MMDENKTMGDWETMRGDAWTLGDATTMGSGEGRVMLAGRYRVVKRLGEGGMGSVWLAEDTKLDGRKVAVKMLPSVLAGKKGAYKQVKAEAMMAMKLSHPNIATVRAFEEDEGGSPFLVMDYIEGEGLDDILAERGPLSEEETVCLLGPVAAALDYAHSQGVVHRDVKPGNVMVRKDGTPFVLDFGIAREIQETLTRVTGKMSSGTLLYMSPEQLHGRSPKASQDVYSFAAMAYECLAGKPPFSRGQIEWQIDHDTPEPLEEGVASQGMRAGILAGLAKGPEGRPGRCAAVLGRRDLATGALGRGNIESRFAGNENERGGRAARPESSPHQGAGGDVFLKKVRIGKELEAAGREKATAPEKTELARIRDFWQAGVDALNSGARADAEELFLKAANGLTWWRAQVEARRKRESATIPFVPQTMIAKWYQKMGFWHVVGVALVVEVGIALIAGFTFGWQIAYKNQIVGILLWGIGGALGLAWGLIVKKFINVVGVALVVGVGIALLSGFIFGWRIDPIMGAIAALLVEIVGALKLIVKKIIIWKRSRKSALG